MRLAISIGHNPIQVGATFAGHVEHYEAAILAGLLVKYTGGRMIGTGSLDSKIAAINAGNFTAAIEVHLNKGGGQGSETLYHPGSIKGRLLAEAIEGTTRALFYSRGAKPGTHRMDGKTPLKFLARTNCPAVIWEAFFMDGNMKMLGDLYEYESLAKLLAEGLNEVKL